MDAARRSGKAASLLFDEPYRRGLDGLERASHVVILTWLHRAARNLIVQKPRHAGLASGVFALRSPARPNPVGLHVARLVSIDALSGVLGLEAIDALDGTPVIDVKPYFASVDSIADATVRSTNG
jgi:tRNA-Thr(GGU) m(6)t(6)A37 methyltransferase TsaA